MLICRGTQFFFLISIKKSFFLFYCSLAAKKHYNFVLVVTIFNLKVKERSFFHFEHQIIQKPEIVHLFIGKKRCGFGGHFCIANLKL